jgi:hypothetical protein
MIIGLFVASTPPKSIPLILKKLFFPLRGDYAKLYHFPFKNGQYSKIFLFDICKK